MQYHVDVIPSFLVFISLLLIAIGGCSLGPSAPYNASWTSHPGVFTQQDVAALMVKWRAEARALWGQAAALQREARFLSLNHPERNEEIQNKLEFAAELNRAGDLVAEQAWVAQRQLPQRMLQ